MKGLQCYTEILIWFWDFAFVTLRLQSVVWSVLVKYTLNLPIQTGSKRVNILSYVFDHIHWILLNQYLLSLSLLSLQTMVSVISCKQWNLTEKNLLVVVIDLSMKFYCHNKWNIRWRSKVWAFSLKISEVLTNIWWSLVITLISDISTNIITLIRHFHK